MWGFAIFPETRSYRSQLRSYRENRDTRNYSRVLKDFELYKQKRKKHVMGLIKAGYSDNEIINGIARAQSLRTPRHGRNWIGGNRERARRGILPWPWEQSTMNSRR